MKFKIFNFFYFKNERRLIPIELSVSRKQLNIGTKRYQRACLKIIKLIRGRDEIWGKLKLKLSDIKSNHWTIKIRSLKLRRLAWKEQSNITGNFLLFHCFPYITYITSYSLFILSFLHLSYHFLDDIWYLGYTFSNQDLENVFFYNPSF